MIDFLLINGFNWLPPDEFTPGLEQRINDAFRKAYLKDTNGECSYDAWWNSGLVNGWNATLEFLKAIGLKPVGKDVPSLEECYEKARPSVYEEVDGKPVLKTKGEMDFVWEWYVEKKAQKNGSAPKSTNDSAPLLPEASPST